MLSFRAAIVVGVTAWFGSKLTTCRSPGEGGSEPSPGKTEVADVTLKGIDASELTTREKAEWSRFVSEFLAPCPDQPVSVAQCVNEARPCAACAPAARFLLGQARKGRVRGQAEASFKARFSPDAVKNVELGAAPSKGSPGASVVIAEFADFECPACAATRPLLDELIERHPNDVRLVFKHFPLTMHPNAEKAARAAIAAQRQDKFWELHAALFENQENLDAENVERLAAVIGLDMKRFVQDRDSEATADAVARDRKQGDGLDLKSTPSLFINGRPFVLSGSDIKEELEEWVKLELELTKGRAAPKAPPPAAPSAPPPPASAPKAAKGPAPE